MISMTIADHHHLFPSCHCSSKGPDRQVQLAITAQKSVSLQFEAAGRDLQVYSKELYLWGQDQPEDIKDGASPPTIKSTISDVTI